MDATADRVIAVVGLGAVLPDARNVAEFWSNVKQGRYSVSDVPPDRWDPALYFDPDPKAPDKSYSRIGGWVRRADWDPVKWRLPIPPRVSDAMDWAQKWAIACTLEALNDYGYPSRPLDTERTAIILGNAMGGERHYLTAMRTFFPEYARELDTVPAFAHIPAEIREQIRREWHSRIEHALPPITEDTMPGELSNCIAGRLANLLNFRGPNFVVDAACASAMAALSAAIEGLIEKRFDAVITGGIDRNMSASTFIKFCKIGALSATGSRPYADGADGFVMGEGAAVFLLKRLADAEREGDKIYAVLRGVGGSSDGKGKGITAPNPIGQRLAISRAWENAGVSPCGVGLIEGHGTSTAVGDLVEVESLIEVFAKAGCKPRSVGLGSVKSNVGHLKSAAGAAGLLKAVLALHENVLPPSANFHKPNPGVDFAKSPFTVVTELRQWDRTNGTPRQAGVSAFGFGGTNFHVVLEEHEPGRFVAKGRSQTGYEPPSGDGPSSDGTSRVGQRESGSSAREPLRGALLLGAATEQELVSRLRTIAECAKAGDAPARALPLAEDIQAVERLSIDYADAADLAEKAGKALRAFESNAPALWKALRAQGVFRGRGPRGKVAFLYTGQGSQYLNMLRGLRETESTVAETFAEADRYTAPLLGRPISQFLFVDPGDKAATARAEDELRQTAITQPAILTADIAITRLLGSYGIVADMVMGHSLGEYGALVAGGAMPFADALEAVSARGREMTRVSVADNGWMVAVFAPLAEIERVVATVDGNVVIANINSDSQAVIGGASAPVERTMKLFQQAGYNAIRLPVSHAFHTSIVAPASEPMRAQLRRLHLEPPHVPIVSNVTGDFYPMGPGVVPQMVDMLARQIASPVQFVKGLHTLFEAGARLFIEVGPKKALQGFAEETFSDRADVLALFTNHPKYDDRTAMNQALCGAYAMGHGASRATVVATGAAPRPLGTASERQASAETATSKDTGDAAKDPHGDTSRSPSPDTSGRGLVAAVAAAQTQTTPLALSADQYLEIGKVFASAVERGLNVLLTSAGGQQQSETPVVVTGASLGLPGTPRVFDDGNVTRILKGEVLIKAIPDKFRDAMAGKRLTRLVKSDTGIPTFEVIDRAADVVKLAGRAGELDLAAEFGVPADRLPALDPVTRLAIAAGLDALRDAGIPLVQHFKTTSKGTRLPDRWGLPEALRDETGIIFTSAFPGMDSYTEILTGYFNDRNKRDQVGLLEELRGLLDGSAPHVRRAIEQRIEQIRKELERTPYVFERRFLLRVLSMGHSQFAELIGARGPNTQINSACASSTMALGLAEDWIKRGRCKRVIVIGADDVTSDNLIEWFGAGFLASGAAATDERVEDAALPFDRRRHGLIVGMGAAGAVIERADSARERGLQPICEVIHTVSANSAFHGTRLDVEHIAGLMEGLVKQVEAKTGCSRHQIADRLVFVSHETYTPARGGSASAEVTALRRVFGASTDKIVVANTKGYTGHPMAVGIEDVVAVKSLETGIVPPVANYREVDPELGRLNLSQGGEYPVEWAMRLAAGFGSQISLSVMRRTPLPTGLRGRPDNLGYAYRIADQAAWSAWLEKLAGVRSPELEVSRRTLRIKSGSPVTDGSAQMSAQGSRLEAQGQAAPKARDKAPTPKAEAEVAAVKVSPVVTAVASPAMPATVSPRPTAVAPSETALADPVKAKIIALVVEKTGYPADMLDLELDLEADLGIDTVKQAELMATIRGVYDIPRDENLKLRDFPTLGHVIQFVYAKRPELKVTASPTVRESERPEVEATQPPVTVGLPDEQPVASAGAIGPSDDPVKAKIIALVVEKTGYPADMLDLELDLEADLGIDTVKQAELMATIRGLYEIPRDENLKLRDFPTLGHVIQFVYAKRPELKVTASPRVRESERPKEATQPLVTVGLPDERPEEARAATGRPGEAGVARARPVATSFEAANRVPRRVPHPVMRPALDFCKPTGVTLEPGRRVIVFADQARVGEALATRLSADGVIPLVIGEALPDEAHDALIANWLATGPISGVYWLPALDCEDSIADMTLDVWREATRVRVKLLHRTMRKLYGHMDQENAFLVVATRCGGYHGYGGDGSLSALAGAVTGFAKAFKRERPKATVKAVDSGYENADTLAGLLIGETLRDPAVVEVGYRDGLRWTVALVEQSAADGRPGLVLSKDSVFVVTGAAGSIVSAIVADLASASGGVFYLFDRVPEPDRNNADLARLGEDREGLKQDIAARMRARGERVTPAMVERELAALERSAAAVAAIKAVEASGGLAIYVSVDLRDPTAVAEAMGFVREQSGRVDVLVHAAGIEISRFLPDKESAEFERVFDVKVDGWFNLLKAVGDIPFESAVAFSSIAGRFGNGGQTDYSAANDLLCKSVLNFRKSRPQTRGIAIDWTAWSGIGMASRGSIPKMMQAAGIEMLAPEAGIPVVRRELTEGGTSGEVVIAGSLGVMLEEVDPVAIDTGAVAFRDRLAEAGPMIGRTEKMTALAGLLVETTLDPRVQPFLFDHQIEGTPVLPGVMGIEAFAELAALLLPGYHVVSVDDVDFQAAFKYFRHEPRPLRLQAVFTPHGDGVVARCRLIGMKHVPTQAEPQPIVNFAGTVRLSRTPLEARRVTPPSPVADRLVRAADIYRVYFHGPAYQVLDSAWRDGDTVVGRLRTGLESAHVPADKTLLMAPRLIEACLQAAGLWDLGLKGSMALPHRVDSVSTFGAARLSGAPVYAVVRPDAARGAFDAEVIDADGNVYVRVHGYRTIEVPGGFDTSALEPLGHAMMRDADGHALAHVATLERL